MPRSTHHVVPAYPRRHAPANNVFQLIAGVYKRSGVVK
jgi:hypothetical protein